MSSHDIMLCNAQLLDCGCLCNVIVKNGKIVDVRPSEHDDSLLNEFDIIPISSINTIEDVGRYVDLEGNLLLPGFVDIHTHLDKVFTLLSTMDADGTLESAITNYRKFEINETVEGFYTRALKATRMALEHGTTTLRTHVNFDVEGTVFRKIIEAINMVQKQMYSCIDIQIVPMMPIVESSSVNKLLDEYSDCIVAIGGAPHLSPTPRANMEWIVRLAEQYGLGVDVHVDEQLSDSARTIEDLIELVEKRPFRKEVIAGHCVSLDVISLDEAVTIAQRIANAGITVVTLPAANLYLQGRGDKTGVRRGVTRVKLLQSTGVAVCAASDNIQDPFHPYGHGDLLEAAILTAYAAHFRPDEATKALKMISKIAGQVVLNSDYGISAGQVADMVVLDARSPLEALQTMAPNRWVFKRGRCVAIRRTSSQSTCFHKNSN